mgnify:CR=1 FL=1
MHFEKHLENVLIQAVEKRYGVILPQIDLQPTKKEFAEFLSMNNYNPIIKALCFAMWDKKDYDKIIWKHIKPEFRKL